MVTRRSFLRTFSAGVSLATFQTACAGSRSPSSEAVPTAPAPASDLSQNAGLYYCPVLPASVFKVSREGDKRIIETNGIPSHMTGIFPNPGCPAAIAPKTRKLVMDFNPTEAAQITPVDGWLFGIAVSGAFFDPTGPYWSQTTTGPEVWEFEVMTPNGRPYLGVDGNSAHVQPGGEYHYHGVPYGLIAQLEPKDAGSRMLLLGYAADGFPIYAHLMHDDPMNASSPLRLARSSYRLQTGARPAGGPKGVFDGTFVQDFTYVAGSGDLDECNGRFGVTPEYPNGIYHYHITEEFPFVPRFYRGLPDPSFAHNSPGAFPNAVPPALMRAGR